MSTACGNKHCVPRVLIDSPGDDVVLVAELSELWSGDIHRLTHYGVVDGGVSGVAEEGAKGICCGGGKNVPDCCSPAGRGHVIRCREHHDVDLLLALFSERNTASVMSR